MKTNKLIFPFLIAGLLLLPSCEPEKKMLVATGDASNISITTADVSRGGH